MKFEFSAGTVVYRYRGGRRMFLFLKRQEGWLDAPKGHIEKGENALEAAIRETREEAGLRVEPDPDFRRRIEYWFVRDGERIKKSVTFFLAKPGAGARIKVSQEHVGYEWLDMDAAMRKISFADQREALVAADSFISRREAVDRVNSEYRRLPGRGAGWKLSRRFVPGDGPVDAEVMIIGQAPGAKEDQTGKPFVGVSGRLLDKLIERAGLRRDDVYITSVVQFFPPRNRAPTPAEVSMCMPFLERQVRIIRPKIIVTVGNFPSQAVAGIGSVLKSHGTVMKSERFGCYVFITLHPAAAVRMKKHLPVIEGDFTRLARVLKDIVRKGV